MPTYKNTKDLFAHIQNKVNEVMQKDVANAVIETAKEHVETDVYAVYPNPVEYERTGKLKDSFISTPINNGIEITNNRVDYDMETGEIRDIPEIIEYGHYKSEQGYQYPAYYPGGANFIQPRPFIENTKQELMETKEHVEVLKQGLNRQGIKTV